MNQNSNNPYGIDQPYQNMDSQRNQIQQGNLGNNGETIRNPSISNNNYPKIEAQGYQQQNYHHEQTIPVGQPPNYYNQYSPNPVIQNGNPNTYQNAPAYGYQNQPIPAQQVYVLNAPADPNYCNICKQMTNSKIVTKPGLGTWLICLGLAFIGLCLCSWIPFCIDDTQDKFYFCMVCATLKGEKKLIR